MSFNSYLFILLFLPLAVIFYYSTNRFSNIFFGKWVLVFASLIFYAYYDFYSLAVLLIITVLNYLLGRSLCHNRSRFFLFLGIFLNIAVLVFFKYFQTLQNCLASLLRDGMSLSIVFPLGISFLTFQQLAYLVDCYRNEVSVHGFLDYLLFATYFPKIAQGPIIYHSEFFPQLQSLNPKVDFDNFAKGIYSFSIGLGKKVLIADLLGKIVDFSHGTIGTLNSFEAILAILAYSFQLYFDFSGYCDMACGVSLLFNIELPQNFNSPYKSLSIDDFWKRWHITLTRFLTKYIYIPLGGNRRGVLRTYLNILIVFLISGIWHGVGLPFLVWGLLHGVAQMLSRAFKKVYSFIPRLIQWLLTFSFLNITWVYFRSESLQNAHLLLSRVFSGGFSINAELAESLRQNTFISVFAQFLPITYVLIVFLALCFCIVLIPKNTADLTKKFHPQFATLLFAFLLLFCSIVSLSGVGGFLYTNF